MGVDEFMRLVKLIYNVKSHINIARGEIGWITGWLPEIVSVGVLLHFFGIDFTRMQVLIFFPILLILLAVGGWIWRKTGFYKIETTVDASVHPVNNEIYTAARRYNDEYNKRKH